MRETSAQEMAEQAGGVIVLPLPAAEAEDGLEQGLLLGSQAPRRDVRLGQPGGEVVCRVRHETASRGLAGLVYSVGSQS